ncbi:hypothetical protein LMG26411_06927 [Cupriavidus numazuensis]|uniref:Uncharacterized protein n=1 Tax=Cupriavidus numazuensis TaxID=221992 RepID=A0ABN7Q925_9BURK|nr:hypothetical protein LMG26411_06927 [Cupriavidus numazuensis]
MPHTFDQSRLYADDVVALQSLAKRRWVSGEKILWTNHGAWRAASHAAVPAREAAKRLVAMGLAEETVCCRACSRTAIQLTDRGAGVAQRLSCECSGECEDRLRVSDKRGARFNA